MNITPSNLAMIGNGFNAAFKEALNARLPANQWGNLAMEITSTGAAENYGWLKNFPGMRKWVGERQVHNVEASVLTVENDPYEHTIGVKRTDIEDDKLGMYTPMVRMQASKAAALPDQLVFKKLLQGFSSAGGVAFDGQYFFDTDHIGYDANQNVISYSNVQTGSAPPWFLIDASDPYMLPLALQVRKTPEFVSKTKPDDDHVFLRNEYLYGVDARYAATYGFYQLAYGSTAPLTADSYAAARKAMMTQRQSDGEPMAIQPTLLLYGPSNEGAVLTLLNTQFASAQAAAPLSNIWYKSIPTLLCPRLG